MVITNFAAGELSEKLFGRIDLGQYYQGVSKLENFNVIPTGGISKRNGTRRLAELEGDGRLIPFIVDRKNPVMLYLTLTGIYVIYPSENDVRIEPLIILDFTSYASLEHIKEVQHAQNYKTMMLVHQKYPPIIITLNDELKPSGKIFIPNFTVEIETGDDINERDINEFLAKEENNNGLDKVYTESGWLKEAGQYPSCVSFFAGRLVFAGTEKNPQRIFASKVINKPEDIYSFATFQYFLTAQRTYVVVKGSLDKDDFSKINLVDEETGLDNTEIAFQFTSALPNYFIESDFFSPETKIVDLKGTVLSLTGEATIKGTWAQVANEVTALRDKFNNYNTNKKEYFIAEWDNFDFTHHMNIKFYLLIGSSISQIKHVTNEDKDTEIIGYYDFILDELAQKNVENNSEYLSNIIDLYLITQNNIFDLATGLFSVDSDKVIAAKKEWAKRVAETMKYVLRGDISANDITYYDYGTNIYTRVYNRTKELTNVYIPFYTKKIISDKYPVASDGFTFEISSDKSDAIKWMTLNKNLIVGTEMAEWIIPAGVTALNLQASLNSRYGSDHMQATAIGDAVCFFQSGKKSLVEYYIPQQDNNFRANNMVMMNEEIFIDANPVEFDFVSTPFTKIFITLSDGSMAVLLYERGTGTFAWGHFRMKHGKILSAATFPGRTDNDEMYLLVKQGEKYFLEYYKQNDSVFLDSYSPATKPIGDYVDGETQDGFIGEPILAAVRSMPILANSEMKQSNIKSMQVRFHDSYFPKVTSSYLDNSFVGKVRNIKMDSINGKEPFTGIVKVPFPGQYDTDVFFEFVHDKPTRCQILAVNAEAN